MINGTVGYVIEIVALRAEVLALKKRLVELQAASAMYRSILKPKKPKEVVEYAREPD